MYSVCIRKKSFIFHPLGALVLNEELTPSGVHIVEIKTGLNCTHVHTVHGVHTKHYIHRVQCKGEVSRSNFRGGGQTPWE